MFKINGLNNSGQKVTGYIFLFQKYPLNNTCEVRSSIFACESPDAFGLVCLCGLVMPADRAAGCVLGAKNNQTIKSSQQIYNPTHFS